MSERRRRAWPQAHADAWSLGPWLGWLTITAVLVAILTDRAGDRRLLVLMLTVIVACGNLTLQIARSRMPEATRRFEGVVLDLWCAGITAFCSALVIIGGAPSDFDWLFVLAVAFVALAHSGWKRIIWLGVVLTGFTVSMGIAPHADPFSDIAVRLVVLAAAAVLVIVISSAMAQEAEARHEAEMEAQLERLMVAEAHHRVKNSLQQVAELIVLSQADGQSLNPLDDTAQRIRAISQVHRVLESSDGASAPAHEVVEQVVKGIDDAIDVDTQPVHLPAATAQQLGIVVNELVTNALTHGRPPVDVTLTNGSSIRLEVRDHGDGYDLGGEALGLRLVREIVEHGLHGRLWHESRPSEGSVTGVEVPLAAQEVQ